MALNWTPEGGQKVRILVDRHGDHFPYYPKAGTIGIIELLMDATRGHIYIGNATVRIDLPYTSSDGKEVVKHPYSHRTNRNFVRLSYPRRDLEPVSDNPQLSFEF